MAQIWIKQLQKKIEQQFGPKKGSFFIKKYSQAFSNSYQEDFTADQAIDDIKYIEELSSDAPLKIKLYEQNKKNGHKRLYLKLIQYEKPIPLSDILPILENMDLRTFSQRPYRIKLENVTVWISDFSIAYNEPIELDVKKIRTNFQEALAKINDGSCENDGFNKLILGAGLPWHDIIIVRAYAKYLHQIGIRYSQQYIEKTFANYPGIISNLINLFKLKFQLKNIPKAKNLEALENQIITALDNVASLDEDRILRHILKLIQATLRTNFYKTNEKGEFKKYFSFKLASELVPSLPLPRPLYEIFVYSPQFEGIHLRSAKVARGGIRWSDRLEDFRTEVLGLMKAQKVKNAIIVPSGAKGGFVLKAIPTKITREVLQATVINCYKDFIRGLLDLTDNLKNGKIIRPEKVVCYDDDDPYLVVAADKGTATFSDIANELSAEYDFWLGDAFASGGSAGYDHKKMGITARGAWESIKRHFHEINLNVNTDDFTVMGIGDMSGDVFGNGMLYTNHIKLVAAFDHRDIFLDPNPDPKMSYEERLRIFNLPRSSWQDYNSKLISKGGGVFSRTLKSITLSPEIKSLLKIEDNALPPFDLIRAILKMPVDLFYNGGIGTYVKAITESHAEVGDKANEFCRVDGNELRCRVVGEGGNLGFTQLGRVEYALQGGRINTDFIDNSAGVDCSDHEVNLKILLQKIVVKGKLTLKKRNVFLASMTQDVADLVLRDNYYQALTMSTSVNHSPKLMGLYQTYLKELEKTGVVNRIVEFLPDDKILLERKAAGKGLTSPELAVLLAYTKIDIKNEILNSNVPEDPYLYHFLARGFPKQVCKKYSKELLEHPLRREIIATQLSNQIVNVMGITFVYRLQIETGASVADIIRAQYIASSIFGTTELQKLIDSTDSPIPALMQYELLHYIRNLCNLATRWFLRGNRLQGDTNAIIAHYATRVKKLESLIPELMLGSTKIYLDALNQRFSEIGASNVIARRVAVTRATYTSLNVIDVATRHDFDLIKTAKIYFEVGGRFSLVWFRDQIAADHREGHWNTLARLTLRDELDILQKILTITIMKHTPTESNIKKCIDCWVNKNARAVERWDKMLQLLYAATPIEYSMFFIAIRELSNWISVIKFKQNTFQ